MADGNQHAFHFPHAQATSRLRPGEIVVDLFAGGGGASTALEQALGRPVDIAINHNPWAVAMHAANHPYTRHMCEDIWDADPRKEVAGRAVGWLHASPDCTHFSQAKGGQPRSGRVRALSWVVPKWAGKVRPRIISLENVHQILKWGPLIAKRCPRTRRVVKLDGSIAAPGERVPVQEQFLIPDKRREGRTWYQFNKVMRGLGYTGEARRLKACDYGAGTSRDRLFGIWRRDGEAIVWPEPTHGPGRAAPYVTAADCIDWSIPCPSIFERSKPLADATMRRIARGIQRYVLEAAEPFIVPNNTNNAPQPSTGPLPAITTCQGRNLLVAPSLIQVAHGEGRPDGVKRWGSGVRTVDAPAGTVTASGSGGYALAAATLIQTGYGERPGQAPRVPGVEKPVGTIVDGQKHAVVTAFLEQAAGGPNSNTSRPRGADEPVSAITQTGSQQRLVTANMVTLRGENIGASAEDPVRTLSAGGEHHAVVECTLSPEQEAGALQVAAFLMRYHSTGGQDADVREPATTISTRDRLALVTVTIRGTPYVIVDIGLRMLQRQELFRAQGFPAGYIIDRTADGRLLTISRSVAMVGNSVSPPPLRAIAVANLDAVTEVEVAA